MQSGNGTDDEIKLNELLDELNNKIDSYNNELNEIIEDKDSQEERLLNEKLLLEFDDIVKLVSFLDGNFHSCFSRFYSYKNHFFVYYKVLKYY